MTAPTRTRRLLVLGGLAAGVVALAAAPASAAPPENGHDCAGAAVSGAAGPGFGAAVSTLAHEQLVDDLGLADCGQANRQNP